MRNKEILKRTVEVALSGALTLSPLANGVKAENPSPENVEFASVDQVDIKKHPGLKRPKLEHGGTSARVDFSEQDNKYEKKIGTTVVVQDIYGNPVNLIFSDLVVTTPTTEKDVLVALKKSLESMGLKIYTGTNEAKITTRLELKIDTTSIVQVEQEPGYETSTQDAAGKRTKTAGKGVLLRVIPRVVGAYGGSTAGEIASDVISVPIERNADEEWKRRDKDRLKQVEAEFAGLMKVKFEFYGLSQADKKTAIEVYTQISLVNGKYFITHIGARNPNSSKPHYSENVNIPVKDFNPDSQFLEALMKEWISLHGPQIFPYHFGKVFKANDIGQQQEETQPPQRMDRQKETSSYTPPINPQRKGNTRPRK